MLISCLNPIPVGLFISYIGCVMALPGISGDNEAHFRFRKEKIQKFHKLNY